MTDATKIEKKEIIMENTIKQQVNVMRRLQEVELETSRIKHVLESFPQKVSFLDEKLFQSKQILDDKKDTVERLKKKYRDYETEVKINLSRISKRDATLSSVKTNKEYQAILKEIEDLNKKNSDMEDEMLGLLDAIEENEQYVKEQTAEYAQDQKDIEHEKDVLAHETEKERDKMNLLDASVSEITQQLDPKLLEKYQIIRDRSGGIAIAAVIKAVCQGCHLNIPPQMYNEMHRYEALTFCPHCHRMVYVGNGNETE